MLQVDDRFEVAASRDAVFELWTAFASFPSFMTGVESVHLETEVRMRWRVSIAGVESTFYALITEQVPGERIAWSSVDQTTMGWWVDLEPAGAERHGQPRTRVTVRVIWAPRGDAPHLAGALELDERTIRLDLQRFRALAEQAVARAA
ncbi:SRPBCC family protein [Agrococcus sp. ARC_14]|uniref:SRPBCC family protein n=1 Tax=Agrococcus sp. ARC_14 TaxID=2919927 RepID=UPI001F0690D8|nr:SRPBCC family protein [Agrococcus sp. ARC_14]MCH1881995.1 cyclase [Agrococcus sp. ARC_14]